MGVKLGGTECHELIAEPRTGGDVLVSDDRSGVYGAGLVSFFNGLDHPDFAGCGIGVPADNVSTVLPDGLWPGTWRGLIKDIDDLRANNDTLRKLADREEVLAGGYTKTDRNGRVAG